MSSSPPHLPLKARLLLAIHSFATQRASRSNYTVNRKLANLFDPKASPSSKPIKGVSSFDVSIDPSRKLWFRLYNPTSTANSATSLPLLIYFHGGGFCFLSANTKFIDGFCRRLAGQVPAVVASVNYRLAPEHRYPCQYEDGFDALKYIDKMSFQDYNCNVDLKRCFIAGDSAGGNLAHHVVVNAGACNEFERVKVVGFVAMQPFFGGEERTDSETRLDGVTNLPLERTDWMWKAFLPEGFDRNHQVVRVFGPNGVDISSVRFPPTLLFIGGFDPLQDWQRRYREWLEKSGKEVHVVEYPNAVHGFYTMPDIPESDLLFKEVKDFVKRQSSLERIL
ncbi:hypothetical protein Tsubulata_025093 [Turnera subulata]|uniref:Alpha/beta hydrolase fold-3 domain-containing protein n=1 Tax=Turnera subulata TaxID=218843 RepID=A0A9Q0G9M2_9ROSI|nr:hypothetical protein Tsubulata_025093 [Turnera subulata]